MTHSAGLRFTLEADPHPGRDRVAARLYAEHAEARFVGQLSMTTAEYNALAALLGQPPALATGGTVTVTPPVPGESGCTLATPPGVPALTYADKLKGFAIPAPAGSFGQRIADDAAQALRGVSEHQRQWELVEDWNRLYQPGQLVLWWLNAPAEDGITGGAEAVTAGKAYQDHGWAMVRLRGLAVPVSLEHVRPMPAGDDR